MAHHDAVDARHVLGDVVAGVFHQRDIAIGVHAAVQQHEHQIGPLGAHLGHVFGGGVAAVLGADLAVELVLVPVQDAGGGDADDADPDRQRDGLAVFLGRGQIALQDDVGVDQRLAGLQAGDVGRDDWEARALVLAADLRIDTVDLQATAQNLAQVRQAEVEFVVAQHAGVVLQHAHGLVHGQLLRGRDGRDLRLVGAQHRALDGVTVVHQQVVRKFGARLADQRGGALQAHGRVFAVGVVVVAARVVVQVGGAQQRQLRGGVLRGGRRGVVIAAAARGQRGGDEQREHEGATGKKGMGVGHGARGWDKSRMLTTAHDSALKPGWR